MFDIVLYQYSILLLRMSAVYSIMLQSLATYKLTGYINIIKINCQNCMLSNSFNVKCFLNQYVNFFQTRSLKKSSVHPKIKLCESTCPHQHTHVIESQRCRPLMWVDFSLLLVLALGFSLGTPVVVILQL